MTDLAGLAKHDPTCAYLIGLIEEHPELDDDGITDLAMKRAPSVVLGHYSARYARRRLQQLKDTP